MKTDLKDRGILALSGGLDSCVCAAIASQNYTLSALHVSYGQRTEVREVQSFHAICDHYGISDRLIMDMRHLVEIGGSSLTDRDEPVPVDGIENGVVPSTYVPFRNANILSAAVSWAEVLGATRIFIGVNEMDSSGYPDCTQEFIRRFNAAVDAGTRPETRIEITAPLMEMGKREIVIAGTHLNAPFEKSWSCYTGAETACSVCDSCRLRLKGFLDAGIKDPLPYEK